MQNPLNNVKQAELQRFLLMVVIVILQLLVFGARSGYAQCDDLVGRKPLRAKLATINHSPIPWSSSRPRLGRGMVVGGDRRRGFVRSTPNEPAGWDYNIAQIQTGRAVSASFVGFFMGHTANSGGGIEGMNSVNVGATTVALAVLIPQRGNKTRKDGVLKTALAEFLVYSTCYALGHGIATSVTPDHASIQ